MAIDQKEYHDELFQEIQREASDSGLFAEDAFFEIMKDELVNAGEIEYAHPAPYNRRGIRVDGYGGDPIETDGVLALIVCDLSQDRKVTTLTAADMEAVFKRLQNFLALSLDDRARQSMEESAPGFGLADMIATRWQTISKVRLILLTNKNLSSRVDGRPEGTFKDIPMTYSVWDLGRLHRYATSTADRDEMEIDLENEFGGPIPLLPAYSKEAGYKAYLAVFPGKQLAAIYEKWGRRLLEQNVRVFLQARGNVNQGMAKTLQTEPDMFFAFNNGIAATAESVTVRVQDGVQLLSAMNNFQIVNGGQTTASIHRASKSDADLSEVFVQMKLAVIEPTAVQDLVPQISRYSNTQNVVNQADFDANHPYHWRLDQFSRRIFAPPIAGSFAQTKWFYERARGHYLDQRGSYSTGDRRKFDLQYPKPQKFEKLDLAKFHNVWLLKPHIVSLGGQKNFANFAVYIRNAWERNSNQFNEAYYRETIAKAIVFRAVEKLVPRQEWYQGGYRANVVAYTIAKLAWDLTTSQPSANIDFEKIWREQKISDSLLQALTIGAKAVYDELVNPPPHKRNVTEWAKDTALWDKVTLLEIKWPASLKQDLLGAMEKKQRATDAAKDQKMLNDIEAQTFVINNLSFWKEVQEWGRASGKWGLKDRDILGLLETGGVPTPKQCKSLIYETLPRFQREGCRLELPTPESKIKL